jgi:hypothetical protein
MVKGKGKRGRIGEGSKWGCRKRRTHVRDVVICELEGGRKREKNDDRLDA